MTHAAFTSALAATLGLSLLVSCGQEAAGDINIVGTGSASLSGVLVQGAGQAAVAGSRVRLYLAGNRSRSVGQTQTGAGGQFGFVGIPAGTYDLAFAASGYAASELLGAQAQDGTGLKYTVQERALRDPAGIMSVPKLSLTRTDSGQSVTGSVRQTFTDRLNLDVQTTSDSAHQRPLVSFEVSLLTADDSGQLAELHPAGGTVSPDPQAQTADSGPLSLGVGSVSGDALLQVAATDFNNNRVAQLYPVTVGGSVGGTVSAPASVNTVAYTSSGAAGVLEVRVSWSMDSLVGVRGFEIWRSGAAAGPWTRTALAEPAACSGSACSTLDTSASLHADQDYFYRVTAVGQNRQDSSVGTQPSTHTLPAFQPALISPAANQTGTPLAPVYTLSSPVAGIGATGAIQAFLVRDDLLGSSTPWSVTVQQRTVLGQAGQAGQAADRPDHQVLLLTGGRYQQVYSDLNPAANVSGVGYDAQSQRLALTHNFDGSGSALQPARRYRWTLERSAAFRVQDPSQPPGAVNPVVAYSVYSDPALGGTQDCPAQPLLPGGPCTESPISLEFTTGAGQ